MRVAYTPVANAPASLMPRLSLTLMNGKYQAEANGLLDTGSAVNILPYDLGYELGAIWEDQTIPVPLTGSLGHQEAYALVLHAVHPELNAGDPIQLVFAWTRSNNVPLIFGQMNFFLEFDVCFYRSQAYFDIHLKGM